MEPVDIKIDKIGKGEGKARFNLSAQSELGDDLLRRLIQLLTQKCPGVVTAHFCSIRRDVKRLIEEGELETNIILELEPSS